MSTINLKYHPDIESAYAAIRKYELETTSKYILYYREAGFNQKDLDNLDKKKIWWDNHIPFDGIPYCILGSEVLDCHHGPDRHVNDKKKLVAKKDEMEEEHPYTNNSKKRFLVQSTKKMDCQSQIILKAIVKFPDFKVDGPDSIYRRKKCAANLRAANFSHVKKDLKIVLFLPDANSHQNHLIGEFSGYSQPLDSLVKEHIRELVFDGVRKVSEMKRHLNIFVKRELSLDIPLTNRRFHPNERDIRNHMYLALTKTRFSKNDQQNLQCLVRRWEAEYKLDTFFLRLGSDGKQKEKSNDDIEEVPQFLFVHQSETQKRLLNIYGQEICLLDATYKTSRYDLPLFLVCVNTNVGYSVVASFIVANENRYTIQEALIKLRDWNPMWKPKYFMCDFDLREIWALEQTFEGLMVYLCDFHREQAWHRLLREIKHDCIDEKDEIKRMLREIADADSAESHTNALQQLRSSDIFKAKVSVYFNFFQRWSKLFRNSLFNIRVNTTNGLERQHKELKENYLTEYIDKSLSSMVTSLVTKYLPDSYERYKEYNIQSLDNYRKYSNDVPEFLRSRPRKFVDHCLARIPPAATLIPIENMEEVNHDMLVRSVESDNVYQVRLNDDLPKCSCPDWRKHHWPCKHMLAVMMNMPKKDWNTLPEYYKATPHFNIDFGLLETNRKETLIDNNASSSMKYECQQDLTACIDNTVETSSTKARNLCLDNIKQITSNLYCINNSQYLEEFNNRLAVLVKETDREAPHQNGLRLNLPATKRKTICRRQKNKLHLKKSNITRRLTKRSASIKKMPFMRRPHWRKYTKTLSPVKMSSNVYSAEPCNEESKKSMAITLTEIDRRNATDLLRKIQSIGNASHYILAKVYGVNVTDIDITSLFGNCWLTDQVIDAYLAVLCQAQQDNGRNILHIPAAIMTNICKGDSIGNQNLYQTKILTDYEVICGVYNQAGNHWDLVILTPNDGRIQFYNPMGFQAPVANQVQRNWSDYLAYRTNLFAEKTIEWKLYVEKHALQLDGYNCGVYCLMFAERILSKKELTGITQVEVQEKRKEIAETLLLYEVYMKDACPCCGFDVQEQPCIGCLICGRHFHKLPFCVGESLAKEDANFFTCKMCEHNIIPDTIDLGGIMEEKPVKDTINPDPYCGPKTEIKKTFSGTTALFVKNLIESKFSEESIHNFFDKISILDVRDCWLSLVDTFKEIKENLPFTPEDVKWKKPECQRKLFSMGEFGDGYIDKIPTRYIRDYVYPIKVQTKASWTIFSGLSVFIFGTEMKAQQIRLAIVCKEFSEIDKTQNYNEKTIIQMELNKMDNFCKDEDILGSFHLKFIPMAFKLNVCIHKRLNGIEETLRHKCEEPNGTIEFLSMHLKKEPCVSYHLLVDGIFILNRGVALREQCGANQFGLCQGQSESYIQCSKCLQNYHRQCVIVEVETFACGCHIERPLKSRNERIYRCKEEFMKQVKSLDIKKLVSDISCGKLNSARWQTMIGTNPKVKQMWKDENNMVLTLTGAPSEITNYVIQQTDSKSLSAKGFVMDVFAPEAVVKVVMMVENINRMRAELFLLKDISASHDCSNHSKI
ncbi:uncharacterized protein LOC127732258 [Mytilus californianus]|uniref:uncharacterized protein LOC127732258 n=1 Tax=Mytilus californianus TaxID=6549 RepID=UPI002247092A|nr:uncharacterized protein LOC127732258 [Mytilus californianus]